MQYPRVPEQRDCSSTASTPRRFAESTVTVAEPGYVAGFNTWTALGRGVNKGQRGYVVLAPVRRTRADRRGRRGEARLLGQGEIPEVGEIEHVRQSIRGFKIEHVFSEYQTSGQPLPAAPRPAYSKARRLVDWGRR